MGYNVRLLVLRDLEQATKTLRLLGVDKTGVEIMAPKAIHRVLKIEKLSSRAANVLKQEMLALGGEAAVHRGVVNLEVGQSDVILMGTVRQLELLVGKLRRQYFDLPAVAEEMETVLANLAAPKRRVMDCRGRKLVFGDHTLVMGILNITPDSFSDGGLYLQPEKALARARAMVEEGADLIDVGAISTRPGHKQVSAEEEWRRLEPVLAPLVASLDVPVSVDTWRASTAEAALKAGANLINDQWALQGDPNLAGVVSRYGAPLVLMHNQIGESYRDLIGDILAFLRRGIAIAEEAGLPGDRIIVDPGIGFGKSTPQNLEVLRRLEELRSLGKPLLLGVSRKRVVGETLGLPVDQRLEGTMAAVALGIVQGVDMVRVHDVRETVRVARLVDAVVRSVN